MTNPFATVDFTETTLSDEGGILPLPFYQARHGASEGEAMRRLMTAILVDAVHCYQAGVRPRLDRPGGLGSLVVDIRRISGVFFLLQQHMRRPRHFSRPPQGAITSRCRADWSPATLGAAPGSS